MNNNANPPIHHGHRKCILNVYFACLSHQYITWSMFEVPEFLLKHAQKAWIQSGTDKKQDSYLGTLNLKRAHNKRSNGLGGKLVQIIRLWSQNQMLIIIVNGIGHKRINITKCLCLLYWCYVLVEINSVNE